MKRRFRLIVSLSLDWSIVVLVFTLFPAPAIAEPATQTIDQLIDGMRKMDARFRPDRPYHIKFEQDQEILDNTGKQTARKKLIVEHARVGDNIYVKSKQDDGREETVYWDGKICIQQRGNLVYFWPFIISQGFNQNLYTNCLFVDTYRGLKWGNPTAAEGRKSDQSEQHFYMLPKMVEQNRNRYKVRPELERVNGDFCHVLEWPGRDIIRVDVAHGYLPRSRRLSYKAELPAAEWENRDLYEIEPNFWLPKTQAETYFFITPAADAKKVRQKITRKLNSISFEPIASDLFEPKLPEKTIPLHVIDAIRGLSYRRAPAGTDQLRELMYSVAGNIAPAKKTPYWLLLNAIAIGLISLRILYKKRSSRD